MTTASWSTVIDQSTDAGFRTWGAELNAKFAAVGMVQTADTGQINWTTVTRAASGTVAGYEIWRLSSSAIYFKIEYGSGTATSIPSFWITAGTGSNGSGTITGQTTTRGQMGLTTVAPASTSTNYQSYLCATADYFGLSWKLGSATTVNKPRLFYAVARTVDSTGTATSVGFIQVWNNSITSSASVQAVATTAGAVSAACTNSNMCLVSCINTTITSSLDGAGNNQAFLWWHAVWGSTPMTPILHACCTLLTDLSVGSTASMTLVGSTSHTYLCAATSLATDASQSVAAASMGTTILWE